MVLKNWDDEQVTDYDLNDMFNESLVIGGTSLIRQLIDRDIDFSAGGFDWFADAYIDADGREDSVNLPVGYDFDYAYYLNKSYAPPISYSKSFAFNSDGTILYISYGINTPPHKIAQYTLSTAWDISTASPAGKELDLSGELEDPRAIAFNTTGSILYVADDGGTAAIFQYTLSTPWDISTGSYASKTFQIYNQINFPGGMTFNSTGTTLILSGAGENLIEYTLGTGWDISTASHTATQAVGLVDMAGSTLSNSGTKIYILDMDDDTVYKYTLGTGWDITTIGSVDSSFYVGDEQGSPYTIHFNDDGSKMYVKNYHSTIFEYYTYGGTSATFDTNKYKTTDSSDSNIQMDIPAGTFSSTVSSAIGVPLVEDWETGADIQYKVTGTSGTEDSGWLNYNEISSFTAFTAEPDTLIIKLIPKETSPTAGYPSIKGFSIRVT